jgi:hypothetical protein
MRLEKEEIKIVQGDHKQATFLLAIPTFGMVPIEFVVGFGRMQMPLSSSVQSFIVKGMEVGVARNYIAEQYQKMSPRPRNLLFIGDDMLMAWNSLLVLYEEMKTDKWDVLTGLYYKKSELPEPLIYRSDVVGPLIEGVHYHDGEVVPVDWTGLDFTLIQNNVFDRLGPPPWFKTGPSPALDGSNGFSQHSEDIWFYDLCRKHGLKVGVHTGVKIAHYNIGTGEVF